MEDLRIRLPRFDTPLVEVTIKETKSIKPMNDRVQYLKDILYKSACRTSEYDIQH